MPIIFVQSDRETHVVVDSCIDYCGRGIQYCFHIGDGGDDKESDIAILRTSAQARAVYEDIYCPGNVYWCFWYHSGVAGGMLLAYNVVRWWRLLKVYSGSSSCREKFITSVPFQPIRRLRILLPLL